ncbi:MAG: hypothetical protein AAF581_10395 [Planctomycetota bacterium]
MAEKRLLMTVEDAFEIGDRGLVVVPELPADECEELVDKVIAVHLLRPDGTTCYSTFRVSWEHFNPHGYKIICRSDVLAKENCPPGTEIWHDPSATDLEPLGGNP